MNSKDKTQQKDKTPRGETIKPDKSQTSGESAHTTPGQAEGDRATVEEALRQKGLADEET